ncbi:hypothetical protein QVD17_01685 [Tagetes erecta]|uniref:Uncharacterized protein n=1 Tax=Tagetes erecta TaxID=13708 RepID=A0AAD8LCK4_TARER|nr:hypothetical protein QVD17_01685 [Tagetes erecta]
MSALWKKDDAIEGFRNWSYGQLGFEMWRMSRIDMSAQVNGVSLLLCGDRWKKKELKLGPVEDNLIVGTSRRQKVKVGTNENQYT